MWLAASVGRLGWGTMQPLCTACWFFSLLTAAFSARLKEHLLWQVAGTDFFPAGFQRKFSKTPVWAEPSHVVPLAGTNTHACPGTAPQCDRLTLLVCIFRQMHKSTSEH